MLGFFSLFWALLPLVSWAASPVVLNDNITQIPLAKHLEILADPEGQWILEEIQKPPLASQFQAVLKINMGPTKVVYWARLTLRNPSSKNSVWFLQTENTQMDEITLFDPSLEGTYSQKQVGNIYPIANRDVYHPLFTFRIETPAQTDTLLYFRLNSYGKALGFPWVLWEEKTFLNESVTSHSFWYAYFGIFAIATGYALFLFFMLRETNYLYYALVTLFNVIAIVCQTGLDDLLFWEIPGQKAHYTIVLAISGTVLFLVIFTRSFLQLSHYLPRWDRVFQGLIGFLVVWLCTFWWIPRPLHILLITGFQIPMTFLMFVASFLRYRQQFKPALFLMGGELAMVVAIFLVQMVVSGVFGGKFLVDFSIAAGRLTESTLLLVALARAYRTVLQEKVRAQNEAAQLREAMVEELKRADQLKDEFLANTSHELKTPLHGIIGLCETTIQQIESRIPVKQVDNLRLITNSAQRLSSLVGDILDFSKLKNHDLQLQLRQIELQSTIRLAEQLCAPLIGSKSIRLSVNLPETPIWIQADENRLQQILINLLSNAIKFTHEGRVEIIVQEEANQVIISVKDTGIGISADHQDQIFRPFFQADGSISREYSGTGLGLAVTKQLVQLHQGELQVQSAPNEGANFFFTLPYSQETVPSPPPSTKSSEFTFPKIPPENPLPSASSSLKTNKTDSQRATILVVDDEPLNMKILQDYLSNTGYRVATASDGFQALEYLETQMPSLILLDVMMPRLNGYEVCRQIRQRYNEAQLPIIMQTVKSQVDDHIQGLKAGANDYLTKPFHYEEMLTRVRSQLKLREAVAVIQENQRLQTEVERAQQIEARLRLSEHRLSKLLDVGNEALLAVNEDGIIVYCNQLLEDWLHYPSKSLQGQSVKQLIPPNTASHPLQFQWSEMQQVAPSLHYRYATLQNGQGELWEGQVWQTLLELEDPIYVLTLAKLPLEIGANASVMTPNWLEEVNQNRSRLQQTIDILTDLQPAKLKSQPHLLKELSAIDDALAKLADSKPSHNPEERFRNAIVEVMNCAVECWMSATQSTAVELAEKSGLWKVYTEENRLRVRVLERYLEPKKLPQKPRWKTVVRTANFVLSHCALSHEQQVELEAALQYLLQLIHQRNLSSSG